MKYPSIKLFFYLLFISALIVGGFSIANGQFSLTLTPSAEKVDFFVDWSAQTSVPSDYNGKSLPTFQSIVTVSATPLTTNDKKINENDYTFNWTLDNVSSLPSNGPLASFKIGNGSGDKHTIYLRIFDENSSIVNEYFMTIPIVNTEAAIYKKNGDGLIDLIGGIIYVSAGDKLNLIAKPFFFSNITAENQLIYRWELNGESASKNAENPNEVEISFPSDIPSGTKYDIVLGIENPFNIYQFVEKKYIIIVR